VYYKYTLYTIINLTVSYILRKVQHCDIQDGMFDYDILHRFCRYATAIATDYTQQA